MKLKVLGSSSSGNCYLLESDTECLILECGISFKEVKKALNYDVSKIVGVLVTHEHKDHSKYAQEYIKSGITVGMSQGTKESLNLDSMVLKSGYWYQFGGFNVTTFRTVHDCAEPFGFIIRHDEMGTLLFATDTEYIKYNFKNLNLNHIMIEANYSQVIIDSRVENNQTVKGLRDRVLTSHMSIETCKGFIQTNKTSSLYTVTLLHLSDGNSNEREFKEEVKEVVGKSVEVFVADKGVEVVLDLSPF